jgi:DNA invertase Pin-like site-specific DNA recombinase
MKPIAYSYVRFSTPAQAEGGSLVRQDNLAQEYATKEGLTLDDKLNMRDLGVSGWSGKNIKDGALGKFVEAIAAKTIKQGSYLLVEDVDRLSRLPVMDALAVFQSIINGGVTIVLLKDGTTYSQEKLRGDWTQLMPVLFSMARSNEESTRKSGLLGKAWRAKKVAAAASLKPLGNNAPLWLTYVKTKEKEEYVVNEERAAIVRRIFKMSTDGMGRGTIAKTLNAEDIPSFRTPTAKRTGKWATSSLQTLLQNRAVLGEYQPSKGVWPNKVDDGPAIPLYYPPIMDEATFYRAQDANRLRFIHRTTRQPDNFNIYQGIVKCALCGSSMHIISKGKPPKGHTYLVCYKSRTTDDCKAKLVRLDSAELMMREILAKVGDKSLVQASSAQQRQQLQAVEGKLSSEQERLAGYEAGLAEGGYSPTLGGLVRKTEQAIDDLRQEVEMLKAALVSDEIIDKEEYFARLDTKNKPGRIEANSLLKRLHIEVHIDSVAVRYHVLQEGQPLLDLYYDWTGATVSLPHTPDQFNAMKRQDSPTLSAIIKYHEHRQQRSSSGNQ